MQSEEGASIGFTGKQVNKKNEITNFNLFILLFHKVIHPLQISVVQDAFSPSLEKIKWAEDLIKGFTEHQKSGKVKTNYKIN